MLQHVPAQLGIDNIKALPRRAAIGSIGIVDGVKLQIGNLVPGVAYALERAPNLRSNDWQLVTNITAQATSTNLGDAAAAQLTRAFYRVQSQ